MRVLKQPCCQYGNESDKRKVLARALWHFDKALIVLAKPRGTGVVTKHNFTRVILGPNSQSIHYVHGCVDDAGAG